MIKTHKKRYLNWAGKYGYDSRNELTLLWYFNKKKSTRPIKNASGEYQVKLKSNVYLVTDLLKEFTQ